METGDKIVTDRRPTALIAQEKQCDLGSTSLVVGRYQVMRECAP
jgi:hypothetical protein